MLATLLNHTIHVVYQTFIILSLPESLCQRLCLAHLQRIDLAGGHSGEGRVGSQSLGHPHGDGSLAGTRCAGNQDRPTSNLALLHHFNDNASCPSSGYLTNHALNRFHIRFIEQNAATPLDVREREVELAQKVSAPM